MSVMTTRLDSRKSLLGADNGYGYGHSYNNSYGDNSYSPSPVPSPQPIPQPPAFQAAVEPTYNQGFAYREGLTPSVPPQSMKNGKIDFMKSRWPACFMAVSLLQAILCICFEAYAISDI
jgi:hypothetical protein